MSLCAGPFCCDGCVTGSDSQTNDSQGAQFSSAKLIPDEWKITYTREGEEGVGDVSTVECLDAPSFALLTGCGTAEAGGCSFDFAVKNDSVYFNYSCNFNGDEVEGRSSLTYAGGTKTGDATTIVRGSDYEVTAVRTYSGERLGDC